MPKRGAIFKYGGPNTSFVVVSGGGRLITGQQNLSSITYQLSWKENSLVVTGLLIAAGIAGIIAGVRNTDFFTVIVFPGPIIGIIIGLGTFGLGMAKVIIR